MPCPSDSLSSCFTETLWDVVENEKKLLMESIPHSGFDEMIMMTKQGKLWKFPIDNEQGWISHMNSLM